MSDIWSHHFMANRWGNNGNSEKLYFGGLQNHCHEIKRLLLLGRKVMTNLDSILKSRDITLPTKVCQDKAMAFLVVMYRCESWTIKKAAAAAKSPQSCPTLCDPIDGSPPGSSVHGISQTRILEWVALSFSRGSSWSRDKTCVSCIGREILYHWDTGKLFQESYSHIWRLYRTIWRPSPKKRNAKKQNGCLRRAYK